MKLSAIVQEAEFRQKVVGVNEASAAFDKMATSQKNAATAAEVLAKQQDISEKSITRIGSKLDAYTRQHDAITKALRDVERGEALIAAARNRGVEVSDRAVNALENAREKYSKLSGVMNDNSKAAALASHQWLNLSRQGQDIATSLAGGQSFMTVMAQQSAQLYDVFASSKSPTAALKEFAGAAGRTLLNPLTLIAGAIGTAGYAMMAWREHADALTISLNGVGRQAGLTAGQIDRLADTAARGSGLSMSSARGYAGQFAGAGVSGAALGGGLGLVNPFSKRLGVDQDTAATTLAGALADPAKGAADLAQKYALLNFAEREQIRSLEAMGDKSAASARLVDVLTQKLDAMKDPTTGLSAALEQARTGFSNFITRIGDELAGPKSYADSIGKIAQAADAAKQAVADQHATLLKQIIDQTDAEGAAQRKRIEQLAAAEKALGDPRAMTMLWQDGTRAADAVAKLRDEIANFTTATQRAAEAAKDQLALAGKSGVEQQFIRLEQQARDEARAGTFSQGAFDDRVKAVTKQYQYDTFGAPAADAAAQMRMLDVKKADLGKSTFDQAFDAAYMEKYNQILKDNVEMTPQAVELTNRYAEAQANLAAATERVNEQQARINSALDTVRSTAKDVGESLVNAFRSGASAAEAMRGVLDRLTSKMLDRTLDTALDAVLKPGGAGGGLFSSLASMFKFQAGGVMTSAGPLPLMAYAGGGVADRPQLAMFGEGRRPEAFVPLADGRNIPVKMHGPQQGGGVNVKVINNVAGAQPEVQRMADGELLIVFNKMIEANNAKVPGIVANAQRRAM